VSCFGEMDSEMIAVRGIIFCTKIKRERPKMMSKNMAAVHSP